jgi:HPt (histidine-containing phosphotransfer) domain-containing protein
MSRLTESQRATFQALRRSYLAQVPARIAAIRRAAGEAERPGAGREVLEDLRHLVHQLVGSSAIFGLPRLSSAARALEDHASRLKDGAAARGGLESLVGELEVVGREVAARAGRWRA